MRGVADDKRIKWPVKDPCIKRLSPCKTLARPLQPIMKDENSNENNIAILEDIYRNQLGIEEDDRTFRNLLRVTSGDQKTWARMVSAQSIRIATSEKRADSLIWNLPILGLWHYRYNLIDLLHKTHWGPPNPKKSSKKTAVKQPLDVSDEEVEPAADIDAEIDTDDTWNRIAERGGMDVSSLQFAADRWGRTKVIDSSNFQAVEEFIIHSYRSRVVAVLLHQLRSSGKPMTTRQDLIEYLVSLDASSLQETFKSIAEDLEINGSPGEAQDEIFLNHKYYCANVQVYLTLKYAIKYADIGLLRYILPYTTAMFHDKEAHKTNYATASLYMLHLTSSGASDEKLQDFVLANSIVNLKGQQDSNFELDRLLELHNGLLRRFINERTSFGNGDPDDLIRRWAVLGPLLDNLKSSLHKTFKLSIDGAHPEKPSNDDVFTMAFRLHQNGEMCQQTTPRSSHFLARNLVVSGQQTLFEGDTVLSYNNRYEYFEGGVLNDEPLIQEGPEYEGPLLTLDGTQVIGSCDVDLDSNTPVKQDDALNSAEWDGYISS